MRRAARSRSWGPQRQFVVGVERSGRLCVLMNPILPGAVQRDLAGEIFKNIVLLLGRVFRPGQELNLAIIAAGPARTGTRQLTNRRMRTFIATPSARNVNNTEDPP